MSDTKRDLDFELTDEFASFIADLHASEMTDVTPEEMLGRIKRGLVENSARFHPKIIVYEGMAGWGAIYSRLVEGLQRLGWRRDGDNWRPPAGIEFEKA